MEVRIYFIMSPRFVLHSVDAMSLEFPLERQILGCLLALN
jgi:hypothetical protein